jgi:hypothetical protein
MTPPAPRSLDPGFAAKRRRGAAVFRVGLYVAAVLALLSGASAHWAARRLDRAAGHLREAADHATQQAPGWRSAFGAATGAALAEAGIPPAPERHANATTGSGIPDVPHPREVRLAAVARDADPAQARALASELAEVAGAWRRQAWGAWGLGVFTLLATAYSRRRTLREPQPSGAGPSGAT